MRWQLEDHTGDERLEFVAGTEWARRFGSARLAEMSRVVRWLLASADRPDDLKGLVVGEIVAVRFWTSVSDHGRALIPAYYRAHLWPADGGEMAATCEWQQVAGPHAPPGPPGVCSCGLYGWLRSPSAERSVRWSWVGSPWDLWGLVRLWGRAYVGSAGIRAERGRVALWVDTYCTCDPAAPCPASRPRLCWRRALRLIEADVPARAVV